MNIPLEGDGQCFGLPNGRGIALDFVSKNKEEKKLKVIGTNIY